MNLEDHVGDILRKGRLHAGVSLETAAAAAGLTPADLDTLENSGAISPPPRYAALAELTGLNARKLEEIAGGWQPVPVDFTAWRELRQLTSTDDGMAVNCYLVWDEVTRDAALFDTGFDAAMITRVIETEQLQLRYVFITHSHVDHVAALGEVRQRFPKARLRSNSPSAPVDQRNRANDCLALGNLRLTMRDTPGHAADGVTYLIGNWPEDAPHVAIVGDALFAGSMGRAAENPTLAKQKVVEQILSLPAATLLCPGHGPVTTVAEEKAHNPFF